MSMNCYIIDDETHAISVLTRYIERTPDLELSGTATNPLNAIAEITSGSPPAITFLDIDMPQLNGMDVAGLLAPLTRIIFTTAFREHALEAFEKDAADYLLKPITYEQFLKSVVKVRKMLATQTQRNQVYPPYFFVKSGIKGKFTRVTVAEIWYIENIGNYVYIHTEQEKIAAYLTLNEVLNHLPENEFSRIHQSFIVNHHRIQSLEHSQVRLSGQLSLPVGATYRQAFRAKFRDAILISKRESAGDKD